MKDLLNRSEKQEFEMIGSKKSGLSIKDTDVFLDVHCQNDFELPLYRKTVNQFVKISSLLSDQPLTIKFDNSEIFNATIESLIV